jgi:transposase
MERNSLYRLVRKLRLEGYTQSKIGELLEITQARVSQILWMPVETLGQWGGHSPSKLSATQRLELVVFLEKGAESYGFEGNIWTSKRVKWLIGEQFKVD